MIPFHSFFPFLPFFLAFLFHTLYLYKIWIKCHKIVHIARRLSTLCKHSMYEGISKDIFIESTAMLCWLNHNDRFVLFWEMLCVFHSSSALFNVCAVLNSCARANRWIDLNLWFVLLCVDDFTAYCWWCAYDNRKHLGSAYYGLLIHFSRKFIWLKCTHLTVWAWTFKLNSEKK